MVIKNFGIVGTTLELRNVFFLLKTHEDSVRKVLAIWLLYAACIQYNTNTKLKFIILIDSAVEVCISLSPNEIVSIPLIRYCDVYR